MNKTRTIVGVALCAIALLAGCSTVRSISNSGMSSVNYGNASTRELREFDVLGIEYAERVSEEEIAKAGARAQRVVLKKGSSILLIQSGAVYPDGPMITELSSNFTVVPFSGIAYETRPGVRRNYDVATNLSPNYSKMVRLAAAKAGADTVVCYWGILESKDENLPTKTVSWVPVVNWLVPDERQHMRIRVKVAVVDVLTGSWTMFSPEPFEGRRLSTSPRRDVADQKQVESLKSKAYAASAKELVKRTVQ